MVATVDEVSSAHVTPPDSSGTTIDHAPQIKCPFCGVMYIQHSVKRCDHLACEVEYVESKHNDFVSMPGHPIVATLFGVDVPRVIAGRYLHFLRSIAATTDTQGIKTLDLLQSSPISFTASSMAVIRNSYDEVDYFCEWTCYFIMHIAAAQCLFVPFVKKYYCMDQPVTIPFASICLGSEVITLHVEGLLSLDKCKNGNWVMITGLPDEVPIFFYATALSTPSNATIPNPTTSLLAHINTQEIVFLNHSASLVNRIQHWTCSPITVNLHNLTHLPTIILN